MDKLQKNNNYLSIVILNYNAGLYLKNCLASIVASISNNFSYEIIVVDNASSDDSIKQAQTSNFPNTKYILLKTNHGFSAGNNQAIKHINPQSTHLLFLNPDTLINKDTFSLMFDFFQNNQNITAATCELILAKTGQLQPECHRGFPTPWRSFCHFTGLGKLFPHSRIFNGYFLGHLDISKPHPIEACVGAFLMVKKSAIDLIGWWCEDYFFGGEDLDFCFQLYKNKFQLWYTPNTTTTHFQGISSGIKKHTTTLSSATKATKIRIARASTQAMRVFYKRNYFNHYNFLTKIIVNLGINILELIRINKAKYL